MTRTRKVVIGVGAILGLGVIGSLAGGGTPSSSPRPSTAAAAEASPSLSALTPTEGASAEPTTEPTPEVTPVPTPEPLAFATIKLTGTRNKVAKITIPEGPAIATIAYRGRENFAVWSVDSSGSETDLLVNTIGNYSGTVFFGLNDHPVAFKIEGRGTWSVTIKPILSAPRWNTAHLLKGKGDAVYLLFPPTEGLTTMQATYRGRDNFAVYAINPDTLDDLIINEIGNFEGEELLPNGTVVLVINADSGSWTFTMS
jgi:hypothetical protein